MERKIDQFIDEWINGQDRLPLLIYGARQTGKTYAVKHYSKTHAMRLVYLNFEENSQLCDLFGARIDADTILKNIELYFSQKIDPANTLIFFDEIQLCERALTSLKYFAEEAPEYRVIASGSLLGVMMRRSKNSFPVGKVTIYKMQPFDFEEFLWAMDQKSLALAIRDAYAQMAPLPEPIHQKALEWVDLFIYLGGMPAVLNTYLLDNPSRFHDQYHKTDDKKADLINAYLADMAKYATPTETSRIISSFNSLPAQLAKENHKFQYKLVKKGASATLFGPSLDWLENAGLVIRCTRLDQPMYPLVAYQDLSAFKIYLHDSGLLARMTGTGPGAMMLPQMGSQIRGAMTENYVASALMKNFEKIFYWEFKSQAEVDFIIQMNSNIIPIEVKSGDHSKSKSLLSYQNRFSPAMSIRLSRKHFGKSARIISVPLYAAFCIGQIKIIDGADSPGAHA